MTAILAIRLACSLILGRTAWAEEETTENNAIQVFYYADEKGIDISFSSELIKLPDSDAAYGDESSKEEHGYQIQVAQNQAMTSHLMTKEIGEEIKLEDPFGPKPFAPSDIIKKLTPGKMPPGKTYYVRVRRILHKGTETFYGKWSKAQKVNTSMKQPVKKLKVQKNKQKKIKISWAKVQKAKGAKKVYYQVTVNGKINCIWYTTDKTSLTCKADKGNNVITVIPFITSTGKMEWSKNEKKNMAYCFGKEAEKKIKL